ncbi:MAG: DUF1080 domain-containing protein [Opitutus sp.]|nr:DUF1080 domain-containing protein [Opitutus sp.]
MISSTHFALLAFIAASVGPGFAAEPTPPPAPELAPELPLAALTDLWEPVPPVIFAPAGGIPSDAIILFDGKNLDAWESVKGGPAPWKLENGAMVVAAKTGYIRTKAAFGSIQLHLEFRTPAEVKGDSQGRGNSGVFFMERYEVQVLDSYNNPTYVNGQVGAVYKQHIPLVNPSRPPGEWQTYDIVFIAPRFGANGVIDVPARITVFLNGVLVQHDVEVKGPTENRGYPAYKPHTARLPISLQDHTNPIAFRNIWAREINAPRATAQPRSP